ncbi:MAG: Ppx/GppA family phosphatase [Novosphingobium sp.]|uniref:Ppx/GppA phosphatase family protein n=1 Tax=Novosphingobium sp. TaxID=1874826 RepID=UPI00184B883C|nr:Ppx/GppA family phosphatase [Novosphingobium sp.]
MSNSKRQAIVDIGSNSIRLVVFGGPPRAPATLFNEKLMAGLGRGLTPGGRLDPGSVATALKGLARFAALLRLMEPIAVRVVATAAVRVAVDGADFLAAVRALGLPAELLSGDEEAEAAGFGVIAAMPEAEGLVADMGGGSLELARVVGGKVHERVSLPFGVIPVGTIRADGRGLLRKALRKAIRQLDWMHLATGQQLYLVGGGWRALARVHMHRVGWPLPVLGGYSFAPDDTRWLKADVREAGAVRLAALPGVSNARAAQLADASALLAALTLEVAPSRIVISSFGLREGLLFARLGAKARGQDPLIEGVRHTVGGQLQDAAYPEALLAWSDGAFPDEPPALRRLRHAACLIAGTGWASNPNFRAIEGEDMALHGNWIGVDAAGRAMMAMALHVGLGGDPDVPPPLLPQLANRDSLALARAWGFALRLAQRLGGGAPQALAEVPLNLTADGGIVLSVPRADLALIDGPSERRLARLALALGRDARIDS